jgi:hypothetical protein
VVDVARDLRAGPEVSAPRAFARVAAIPAWVWLTGIVLASFGGRLFAAVARLTPYYLPDEYIYPSLARSLAESGRPLIRGAGVHFPALLDPIVTAPVWLLTNDPVTAFRLTQGIHAVLFSLAAIPAYLLCRRLGLSSWRGIAVAALTVAVPDGVYSSTMLADPLAYPLVLSAVYAGVCVVSEPTLRAQLAFAVFSALSVFARIQYVIVPVAVLAAELVADRFNVVRAVRRVWLALSLLIVPPALLLATLGSERLFGVYANGDHAIHAGSILRWVGLEAMLLTYSSGWVIVPGALAGVASHSSGPVRALSTLSQSRASCLRVACSSKRLRSPTRIRSASKSATSLRSSLSWQSLSVSTSSADCLVGSPSACSRPGCSCSRPAFRFPATRRRTTRTTRRRSGPCFAWKA